MKEIKDVVIIGAGPAGLSAALYSSRSDLNTAIIYDGAPGGKLLNTHMVDNYIGMPESTGANLAFSFYEHIQNNNILELNEKVIDIKNHDKDIKIIVTNTGKEIETKTIIITSGSTPKSLDVPGYEKYFGKGVSTCVVCDGPFFKGKEVAVIGGGLSAVEESLYSKGIISNITIFNKYPSLKIDESIKLKLDKADHIVVKNDISIIEIIGNGDSVTAIEYSNKQGEKHIQDVSGVFVYEGWNPANEFLKSSQLFGADGFVEVNKETMETKVSGIFAAGDIVKQKYSQVSIAVSDGAKAALSAKELITFK